MEKIIVNTRKQLDELEKESALTWVGLDTGDESLKQVLDWIREHTPLKRERVYITSGFVINAAYGLTGNNAYPDDMNIVSVKLGDIEHVGAIVLPRFEVGGRWFDDIVVNNRRHEEEQV